jgi:hypothetical protein
MRLVRDCSMPIRLVAHVVGTHISVATHVISSCAGRLYMVDPSRNQLTTA